MKIAEMTIQCCVCSKIQNDSEWLQGHTPQSAVVSHSYCPSCLKRKFQKLDAALPNAAPSRQHAA